MPTRRGAEDTRRNWAPTKLLVDQAQRHVAHPEAAGCGGQMSGPQTFGFHPRLKLFQQVVRQSAMRDELRLMGIHQLIHELAHANQDARLFW